MSDKRFAMIFLRLGLLASVLFAAFWGGWQLSGHQVSAYTSIKLTKNISLTYSFSRWWDVSFAFLVVNLYAWILRIYYKLGKLGLKFIVYKIDTALTMGLIFGLIIGTVLGLIFSLIIGFTDGLIFSLANGLAISLAVGFTISFIAGLYLFSSKLWKSIFN